MGVGSSGILEYLYTTFSIINTFFVICSILDLILIFVFFFLIYISQKQNRYVILYDAVFAHHQMNIIRERVIFYFFIFQQKMYSIFFFIIVIKIMR